MMTYRCITILGFYLFVCLTSNCQETKIDSTILNVDSAAIDGMRFKAIYRTDGCFYILDTNEKIMFKSNDYYRFFEFVDFDSDGNKDILFNYIGNVPINDLLLYDVKSKGFIAVENFSEYPEPIRIGRTKYYYSYHRSGCADMNWDSDLFYIENFKTHKIGTISGRECDGSDEKAGIYIYKMHGDKAELVVTKEINEIHKFKNDKWDFINEYWSRNFKAFE